jgi:hypothetical protein
MALCDIKGDIIVWPAADERKGIAREFEELSGIPNIVGCGDGTIWVLAHAPELDPENFYTRKKNYGINGQVVADAQCRYEFRTEWPCAVTLRYC